MGQRYRGRTAAEKGAKFNKPVNALPVVNEQGPRRLVPAKQAILLCLRAAAEAGASEADCRPALGRDDAQLPVELAFARR